MRNFNKVRKISGGGNSPSPELQGNNNLEGSNNAIEGGNNKTEGGNNVSSKAGVYTQILNALGGAASVGSNVINQDMYYTDGWNKAGQVVNSLSGIPILGPASQVAKFGVNSIAKGLGTEMGNFDFDKGIAERQGGSYSGWLANANRAKSMSGKTALGKAFREGSNTINNSQIQIKTIEAIDKNAQNAYARAANTQLNHMQYETTLNGGFDPRYMAIAKLGIKLENLNRLQTYKIKQIINVNTKQIEEFKNGGSISEEFTPTIIEEPWIPEIVLDVFKDGGKTDKKSKSRTIEELIEYAKIQNPRFIQRMSEPLRYIRINTKDEDGKESWGHATHEMNYRENEVFPMVQEINGKLYLFESEDDAYDNAKKTNNILTFDSEDEAKLFAVSGKDKDGKLFGYKLGWQDFFELSPVGIKEEYSVNRFKDGGKTEETELVKLEETNQKNVIPEGALHKNKHHIENTDSLTQKGIPVIDNDGEQQAEIELDEIIFTLEVTKKLEELHKLYKEGSNKERDEAAIEAGKLLVQEILYNTDDRTGLIAKCEKGGKL